MTDDIKITIVVVTRDKKGLTITFDNQSFKSFKVVVIEDSERRGANWARNEGFKQVDTEFVLFCDDDIIWEECALEILFNTLNFYKEISYVYCSYWLYVPEGKILIGHCDFNSKLLKEKNYISTMSLIRTRDFTGFDENIKRLQDWDLWLTMLEKGKIGKFCGKTLFQTTHNPCGISTRSSYELKEAYSIVRMKHKSLF